MKIEPEHAADQVVDADPDGEDRQVGLADPGEPRESDDCRDQENRGHQQQRAAPMRKTSAPPSNAPRIVHDEPVDLGDVGDLVLAEAHIDVERVGHHAHGSNT